MAPIRTAFVVDSETWGGAEVYVAHLLRHLPDRFERALVVAEPTAARLAAATAGSARVTVVPLARGQERAPATEHALAALRPDLVHVNLVDPASNRAALAAGLAVAPVVATLHLEGDAGQGILLARLRALYGRLGRVLAVSRPVARQLSGDLGVPTERVVRVPNGVEPIAPAVRARSREVTVLGAVGRITAQKGFDVLVEAVRRLAADGRRFGAVIAGEGRDRQRLAGVAADAGLPMRFIGFQPDVPTFLRGLDVFCLPSRREALPLALLEAMSAGLPCVASAVGDIAEAVGDDVLLVPPGDVDALAGALDRLLGDPGLRAGLGARARRRVLARFDAQSMAARTAAVLAAALPGGTS